MTWFLDQDRNQQLNLTPPYQRRSVWTAKDRGFFLDTILKGYPCPAIFLHKRVDPRTGRAVYDVVDGKQRLETILKFANDVLAVPSNFSDARFAGKKFSALGTDERRVFWDYVLPVEMLDFGEGDLDSVDAAFDRLNRNSRKLTRQELRHARYDGWFIETVEQEADDPFWREMGIVTNARQKRMHDTQYISELLLVAIERRQIGFDQDALDQAYVTYSGSDEEGASLDTDQVEAALAHAKTYLADMNAVGGPDPFRWTVDLSRRRSLRDVVPAPVRSSSLVGDRQFPEGIQAKTANLWARCCSPRRRG